MSFIFADTHYFVALINPHDQWRQQAINAEAIVRTSRLVTTEAVLIEVLNFMSSYKPSLRKAISLFVRDLLADANIETVPHSRDLLLDGLTFYEKRSDKAYSLTDCISMIVARDRQITRVLTHDHHFAQEGFELLL